MAGKSMQAVHYSGYGGGAAGLKHVEVPIPSPKKDEILLKLEATSINPFDWKVQKGMLRPFLPPKFPFIPCVDVTGEVAEVGPGVRSFKAGDKVVAMLNVSSSGGLAEYAVAPVPFTVSRPPELSPAEGAGLPTAAVTALQALKAAGTKFDGTDEPSNVLITAASGGVGHFVVQLAKLANLHVTATCGARNLELVKSLGADEVLDYKTPDGASLKSPSNRKYDFVIHCTTGIAWSTFEPNLTTNGKVIDITPSVKAVATCVLKKVTFSKKKLVPLLLAPKMEDLNFVVELVKEGKIKTVVDSRHPLSKAEEAWAKSIDGHATGKIIVEM
ncbi:chloroplast envelope quinone oxidoreductase homolog [Elaeis guineensis]|uniref:Chloroplast envelope quinone oxidoreductase homolog n=1 Tax=Elaeis guineensis var. tenera TaxID=51953 RepID=A0A6I9QB88_ELAGV|nr:chloroplast envelope quinone oxidoreductase homolog [Elaeis guineensis]